MKRVLCILFLLSGYLSVYSQNPTYTQKIYYTCKVWGFVKYYHSEVSTCQVNWDSVLIATLPIVKNSITKDEFNDALDSMLQAAGPMAIVTTPFPDTLPAELKRNRNFGWFNDTMIRSDVKIILDTIKNNFRPHPICWVEHNTSSTSWLTLPYDNPLLNVNIIANFPNEWNRLLILSKYWNIINYFNPYNYVLDNSIDSTLADHALPIANATTYTMFYKEFELIVSKLNDAHAEGLTWSNYVFIPNYYTPKIILKFANNRYVVAKSDYSVPKRGDRILSIDGLTMTQWEDSLRPYISAGNDAVFRRFMCDFLLKGSSGSPAQIIYEDSIGNSYPTAPTRSFFTSNTFFTSYYENDTLGTVKWKHWNECNIGYVNMGQLLNGDVIAMYNDLQNTSSIIFDLRNYPNGTISTLAYFLFPASVPVAKFMIPDVEYPGTFYWQVEYYGPPTNSSPYQGRVILLMNEETQSQAEYSCMIFETLPNVVKVGSQTAGADGNITSFKVGQDINTGFTSLGTFYPNGDSTQRIGIVPDSLIYPSQIGIRHGRDEVLEKALQIAGCWLSVDETSKPQVPFLCLKPNPTTGSVQLVIDNVIFKKAELNVIDLTGRSIHHHNFDIKSFSNPLTIDVSHFQPGIYFVNLVCEQGSYSVKLIKE